MDIYISMLTQLHSREMDPLLFHAHKQRALVDRDSIVMQNLTSRCECAASMADYRG